MGANRRLTAGMSLGSIAAFGVLIVAPQGAGAGARPSSTVQPVAHRTTLNMNQSGNWSGYNIGVDYPGIPQGTTFTSISGRWVVPTATPHQSGQAEHSATWVGIGGGCVDDNCDVTDNTLIQAGTSQDVSKGGGASYDAWWEIIPETETKTTLAVSPGNTMQVTIDETSSGTWSIAIDNLTTGKTFTTSTPYSSSMDTAEWIEETPVVVGTAGAGIAAMPNLTTVKFRAATLNGANPHLQPVDEMQLDSNGAILATPSAPNSKTNGFNDCTYATSCPAPGGS